MLKAERFRFKSTLGFLSRCSDYSAIEAICICKRYGSFKGFLSPGKDLQHCRSVRKGMFKLACFIKTQPPDVWPDYLNNIFKLWNLPVSFGGFRNNFYNWERIRISNLPQCRLLYILSNVGCFMLNFSRTRFSYQYLGVEDNLVLDC